MHFVYHGLRGGQKQNSRLVVLGQTTGLQEAVKTFRRLSEGLLQLPTPTQTDYYDLDD